MNRLMNRMRANEEGNGLIFALLVLFVCISIAAIVAALALTNSASSKNLNGSLAYQAATDTALAHALQVANAPAPNGGYDVLYNHQGAAKAVTGTAPGASSSYPVKWRWYSLRVASEGGAANSWYIYADAYKSSPSEVSSRHVRELLDPLTSKSATVETVAGQQRIAYQANFGSAFQYGLSGVNGATINNAQLYSYDSTASLTPSSSTGAAELATNQVLTLGDNTSLNAFRQFNGATCTPAANCPPTKRIAVRQERFNYNLNGVTLAIAAACPQDAAAYPSWSSSSNATGSNPLRDGQCYNTVRFDTNYPQLLNRTRVYVKGDLNVDAGVQVNYQGSPENLQIYSQAGSAATFNNGSATSPTYFNAVVAGAGLGCRDTATNPTSPSTLFIYGSLACSTINFGPSSTIWIDAAASNSTPSLNVSTVYQPTYYEVYSK